MSMSTSLPPFATTTASKVNSHSRRLKIIDTDVGFDDLVAIHALVKMTSCHHQSTITTTQEDHYLFTTTCGMSQSTHGAQTLRTTLETGIHNTMLASNKKVSFAVAAAPNAVRHEPSWIPKFRLQFSEFHKSLQASSSTASTNNLTAFDAAMDVFRNSPKESVDVLCLGPLSNLASWLESDHELVASKIRHLWISGGNYPSSNLSDEQQEEFNFSQDPRAVAKVFLESPGLIGKITVVPGHETGRQNTSEDYTNSIASAIPPPSEQNDSNPNVLHRILVENPKAIYYDPVCCFLYHHHYHHHNHHLHGRNNSSVSPIPSSNEKGEAEQNYETAVAEWERVGVADVDPNTGVLLAHDTHDQDDGNLLMSNNHPSSHYFVRNVAFDRYKQWILSAASIQTNS